MPDIEFAPWFEAITMPQALVMVAAIICLTWIIKG